MKELKAIYRGDKKIRSGIVTRLTMAPYQHGRRLVVSLEPGDILRMREAGRRTSYNAGLGWAFMQLARKHALEQAEIARQKREARRKGLT
jgi:hypothetical protein